jgi:hypothetical protein
MMLSSLEDADEGGDSTVKAVKERLLLATKPGLHGTSRAEEFVSSVAALVADSIDIASGTKAAEPLHFNGKVFRQRMVDAFRSFIPAVAPRALRETIWASTTRQRGTAHDTDLDAKASLLLVSRVLPIVVQNVLEHAYAHEPKHESSGVDVVHTALSAVVANRGVWFDEVAVTNLTYLTGFVVRRVTEKVTRRQVALKLSDEQAKQAQTACHWMNTNTQAYVPGGDKAPTQGLVHPREEVVEFMKRLEAFLQKHVLHAERAAQQGANLFTWAEAMLKTSPRVRTWWQRVECACNKDQGGVEGKQWVVSKRVLVTLLQAFVEQLLLSKQRTWRVGFGVAAESMNQLPLRTALRAARITGRKEGNSTVERQRHLPAGTLDALFASVSRVSGSEAEVVVAFMKEQGARATADAAAGAGAGAAAPAAGTRLDASPQQQALDGAFKVTLAGPHHGLTFTAEGGTTTTTAVHRVAAVGVGTTAGEQKSHLLCVGSRGLRPGDFVLQVSTTKRERKSPDAPDAAAPKEPEATSHRARVLNPAVLVSDKGPQYPLVLLVLPSELALVPGVVPTLHLRQQAAAKTPKRLSKKRQAASQAAVDTPQDAHAPKGKKIGPQREVPPGGAAATRKQEGDSEHRKALRLETDKERKHGQRKRKSDGEVRAGPNKRLTT